MPYQSDATRGSAAKSLSERAVSVVRTRTRKSDPPLADLSGVCITLDGLHVRDADTRPSQAIRMAVRRGDLVALTPPERERECLGLPDPAVFRAAFDDPTPEQVRAVIREEADRDHPRRAWIGALNGLLADLR